MFEVVEKEEARGVIAGSDYGAAVRVIMRSPGHVLFSARGVQLWNRSEHGGWHNLTNLTRKQPSKASLAEIAGKLDEVFGAGAAEQVIAVSGKSKTILVDGGGEPMPLPNHTRAKISRARYAEIAPDAHADLTGQIACCLQCGKQLRPDTDHHRLGFEIKPDHPRSLEDCQRLTNARVIACHGYGTNHPKHFGLVSWFEVWDGESMVDEDFCSVACAATYGRRAAKLALDLEPGVDPPKKPHRIREDTEHFEKEERFIQTANGRIRI